MGMWGAFLQWKSRRLLRRTWGGRGGLKVSLTPRNNQRGEDFPDDIDEADLAEKENGIRLLLTANQQWMHDCQRPG